jgi:hypothetical protein
MEMGGLALGGSKTNPLCDYEYFWVPTLCCISLGETQVEHDALSGLGDPVKIYIYLHLRMRTLKPMIL